MNYARMSVADLLAALATAGRNPPIELIKACLAKRIEIRRPLLETFARAIEEERARLEEDDDEDDLPEAYLIVHCGILLIALREAGALPYFAQLYGDDNFEVLLEWFETAPSFYGPAAIPTFLGVLRTTPDEEWRYNRSLSTAILEQIGMEYPAARQQVVDGLRSLLPELDVHGQFRWPEEEDLLDGNWGDFAGALGRFQDQESAEIIMAMYDEELIDEDLISVEHYLQLLDGEVAVPAPRFDILSYYQRHAEARDKA